jgi:outer membrane protein TolC
MFERRRKQDQMTAKKPKRSLFARLTLLFLILLQIPAFTQQNRTLTLDQSLQIALDKSFDAKRLEQSLINSRMSLKAARLSFKSNGNLVFNSLPNFQQSERQTALAGGAYTFDSEKFLDLRATIAINQPIPATDGVFSLVGVMQRFQQFGTFQNLVFDPVNPMINERVDPSDYAPQLRLQFRQPLFTLNKLKTGVLRAELNLENTLQTYTRTQLDIIFNVTSNFYALYRAQRQVEIDRENVGQSENAYRIARLKEQAGLLPEVEALRLEVDLANARNTAAASEANLRQTEDIFKLLIGIAIEDTVSVLTDLSYTTVEVTVEHALEQALKRRTELRYDDINIELNELSVKEVDTNSEIRGDLFLSYGIFNRQDKFEEAFKNFNNDRSVNFSLTLPLWDWGKNRSEVEAAIANLESSKLTKTNRSERIKQEIRAAVRNLHSAQQRIEITKRSEELAQKSYRISLLRFENGDISSQDLALEQNRYTQARTNYLNAVIDYKQALADLRRKTLWDYERNAPVEVVVPE